MSNGYRISMQPFIGSTAGLTTGPSNIFIMTVHAPCILREFRVACRVVTTNDASNYWTLLIRNISGATIASRDTAALTAGIWSLIFKANIGVAVSDADVILYFRIEKVGAPGAIDIAPPVIVFE